MNSEQSNIGLVAHMIETLNAGDIEAVMRLYSERGINHGFPVTSADIRYILEDIRGTFPDMKFEPVRVVASGEWVVLHTRFRGTHLGVGRLPVNGGMLVGLPPTRKSFAVEHIHMWRIQNEKIVEHYATRDDIEMMRQLDLLPALG